MFDNVTIEYLCEEIIITYIWLATVTMITDFMSLPLRTCSSSCSILCLLTSNCSLLKHKNPHWTQMQTAELVEEIKDCMKGRFGFNQRIWNSLFCLFVRRNEVVCILFDFLKITDLISMDNITTTELPLCLSALHHQSIAGHVPILHYI